MNLAEASKIARAIAPPFLRGANAVPAYEDAARVVVAYQREAAEGVLQDLYVAVVERATGAAEVVPFISVIDSIDGMRELPTA